MKDINKVILVGRLGADPVLRKTSTGTSVAHFPLATGRRIRADLNEASDEGNSEREEAKGHSNTITQWHSIVAWGRSGESCAQYLKKGTLVYVEGSIRSSKYKDKEGRDRISFEILCRRRQFFELFL